MIQEESELFFSVLRYWNLRQLRLRGESDLRDQNSVVA